VARIFFALFAVQTLSRVLIFFNKAEPERKG